MCTVSFYRNSSSVVITSSRDENANRPLAIQPEKYVHENINLYYPKDPQAGGTWFSVKETGAVFVLLNGSKKAHKSNPPYRKSRGLMLLEIACSNDAIVCWRSINLKNIEPFTMVVFEKDRLYQLRWKGDGKSCIELDQHKPHIWSSSTIYSPKVMKNRERWFKDFLSENQHEINEVDLFKFHDQTNLEDLTNGLVINRNQELLTRSITQCVLTQSKFFIKHKDFTTYKVDKISFLYV